MVWLFLLPLDQLLTLLLPVHPWFTQVYLPSWWLPSAHIHSHSGLSLFQLELNSRYLVAFLKYALFLNLKSFGFTFASTLRFLAIFLLPLLFRCKQNRYPFHLRVATRPGSPSTDAAAKSFSTAIGGCFIWKQTISAPLPSSQPFIWIIPTYSNATDKQKKKQKKTGRLTQANVVVFTWRLIHLSTITT